MSEDKYHLVDPEQEILCPYDKTHMVRVKRFPYHLMKCRQNHPGTDFASCPFNAKHEVRKPELRYHVSNCPDRCRIDNDIVYERQKRDEDMILKGCTDVPAYNNVPVAPSTESWDLDSQEAGDRYRHTPGVYKNKTNTQALQKRQLQQYLLRQKRPQASPTPSLISADHQTVSSNPIFAMTMAGVGRGRGHSTDSAVSKPELLTAQQLMATVGRGRGMPNMQ